MENVETLNPDLVKPTSSKKKNRYVRWSKGEIDKMGAQIAEYRLQGLSLEKIANLMNITKGQAFYIYEKYNERFYEYNLKQSSQIVADYHRRMEWIWRTHLAKYNSTIKRDENGNIIDAGEVRYLKDAARLLTEHYDRLQSAGIIPRAKEKIEIEGNVPLSYQEFLKAFKEFKEKQVKK